MKWFANRLRTMLLYRQQLSVQDLVLPPNVRILQVQACDMDLLKQVNPELNVKLEERKFGEGHCCHLAYLDNRPAGYGWVQHQGTRIVEDLGCKVHLPPGHIWLYAAHTAEWARGNRLQGFLQSARLNHFATQGYSTAWILVNAENTPSRRTIERLGFEFHSTLRALVLGKTVICLSSHHLESN